jgi:hypothetical protein
MHKTLLRVALVAALFSPLAVLLPNVALASVGGPTCIVPTDYSTIQAAVNDTGCTTINVSSGTYTENVTIARPLTLNGAQAGVDARTRAATESVIDGVAGPAITITADNVTIDGFSLNGPVSSGTADLVMQTGNSGEIIKNNIFNNPGRAASITTSNTSFLQNKVINVFATATDGFQANSTPISNLTISNNSFSGADESKYNADITVIEGNSNVVISGNSATGDGTLIALFKTNGAQITNNTIVGAPNSSAVYIGGANSNVTVSGNDVSSASTGVNIANDFADGVNSTVSITTNKLHSNGNGIKIGSAAISTAGTIVANRNQLTGNTAFGFDNLSTFNADATCNWWGTVSGPGTIGPGTGDLVTANATFQPWLTSSDLVNGLCNGPIPAPKVTTNPADNITSTGATLHGTDGSTAADNTSFWYGPTPVAPITFTPAVDPSSQFPAGWSHDGGLGSIAASGTFSNPVTGLTSGTSYSFVAWVQIDGTWYPDSVLSFNTPAGATPSVTTNPATNISISDATLNGTNGAVAADAESFWVSTSTINTSSPNIPANVYSTPVLPAVGANVSFSDPLSIVTTNGITTGGVSGNMAAITANTKYYFVAWSEVAGTWYPDAVLNFTTDAAPASCPVGTSKATSALETDTVNSSSAAAALSSHLLANGQPYLLVSSGTWQNGNLNAADTAYASVDNWATHLQGYNIAPYMLGSGEFQLQVDDGFVNWGSYSPAHTYSYVYTGNGAAVKLGVFDGDSTTVPPAANLSWYSDNSGNLSVSIYPCVSTTVGTASISGSKFEDWDGDHSPFETKWENGLKGWTITLSGNGISSSTVTNKQGSYLFAGLPAGTYTISEVQQPNWIQTYPATTTTAADFYTVTVAAGQVVKKKDFGNFKLGAISGTVYNDKNGNGNKNSGDTGLAGWTVKLKGPNGTIATTTDAKGNYSFTGLTVGKYVLSEIAPVGQTGWKQTDAPDAIRVDSAIDSTQDDFGNYKK